MCARKSIWLMSSAIFPLSRATIDISCPAVRPAMMWSLPTKHMRFVPEMSLLKVMTGMLSGSRLMRSRMRWSSMGTSMMPQTFMPSSRSMQSSCSSTVTCSIVSLTTSMP